jgi:hypothetical protein
MIPNPVTASRIALAFAAGVALDLIVFLDAYPYNLRYQHQSLAFWVTMALPFACAFLLDFKALRPGPASPPGSARGSAAAALDSRGLLMACVILLALTVAHIVAVIRDTIIDPTTHNLVPFEFAYAWIVVGVPAAIGSLLARGICWVLHRFQLC